MLGGFLKVMKAKRITIKDIAEKAEVSETTVSRFINKKYEYMSEATRRKVEKVVKELNYRPSNIARSLKSNKSKILGAVIADIENPFSNLIIKGLIDRSNALGYSLMVSISNNLIEKENEGIRGFIDNNVEGLIVNTVTDDESLLQEVSEDMPVLLIDRGVKNLNVDLVTSDNYELGRELVTHLIDSGFKRIGFFSEKMDNNTVRQIRHQAFRDCVEGREDIDAQTIIIDREKPDETAELLHSFLSTREPRVIIAGNGLIQLALMQVLKEHDYVFGEDFNFCGFDDWAWSTMIGEDGITTIAQDSYRLGTESIDIIHKRLTNELEDTEPVIKTIEGQLIVRGSTKIQVKE